MADTGNGQVGNSVKIILRIFVFNPRTSKVTLFAGGFCAKRKELAVRDNGGDWKDRG